MIYNLINNSKIKKDIVETLFKINKMINNKINYNKILNLKKANLYQIM